MGAITVIQQGGRFVARCSYEQREIPKEAGFRWDREKKCWYTQDPGVAAKLTGDPEALAAKITEREQVKAAAIASSRAADADVEIPVPEGLSYLPYQRAGIAYSLAHESVLIGDDMGLGKTIQAIGISNADPSIRRVLIVCPASLKLNWMREWQKWSVREMSIGIAGKQWPTHDICIINYDILKKHIESIRRVAWDLLICDESHYLKNPKAQRTQFVVGKERRKDDPGFAGIQSRRRVCLSGTPIPNRPVEGWSVFHFLDPKTFDSFFPFVKRYCGAYQGSHGWDFSGASHLDELQDKLRSSIMIRRKKADVLTELPAKRRQVVELEMSSEMADAVDAETRSWAQFEDEVQSARVAVELAKAEGDETYQDAVQRLRSLTQAAFTEMSKLRHDTAVRKVPLVIDDLRDMIDQRIKVVAFAHHKDVIGAILEAFPGISVSITGDTEMHARQRAVDRFQTDPECLLFVGNIQAAGVGITLTAASNVVFAELDWVPGNITQAEDRCHRIGQRDTVFVRHLVLDGSLDAKMAKTLVSKQEIIDQALDRERVAGEMPPVIPSTKREEAATESTTREKVAETAKTLTLAQVEGIHACLQVVAGMCDGAREKDDSGFNAMDAKIGKSLAYQAFLTPRQAALGLKIVAKYRRQIPPQMLAAAKGE